MKSVGTADLKAHLSAHLRAVRRGQSITVLDRREPIARIVPLDDRSLDVIVRPAKGILRQLALPSPTAGTSDVVEDLLSERRERS